MTDPRELRVAWRAWAWALGPIVLALAVFAQVIGFPFVNWDDPSHVTDNPLVVDPLARGFEGLFWTREIGYPAPVLLLSFALDHWLWGSWAAPYHAQNLLLHLLNMGMLYWLARRVRLTPIHAAVAVALFGVHPLVVEPVAWVTGRKDLFSVALLLVATLIASGRRETAELGAAWRWLVANLLAVLAVLVLPRMVVGPVLIALFVLAVQVQWAAHRVALRLVPSLVVCLGIVLLGTLQVRAVGAVPTRSWAGATGDVVGAWAHQFQHLLWPFDFLSWYERIPGDPSLLAMFASIVGLLLTVAFVWHKTESRTATRQGALMAAVAYAPVSSVFGIHRWTADSYMYFPLAALAIAVVPALGRVWPARLRGFGLGAAAALLCLLALLSFNNASRWSSSSTLWAGSIARYPNSPLAHEHEALALLADGNQAASDAVFLQMAERFPDFEDALPDYVRVYRANGDDLRARDALLRGVKAGQGDCLRMYWINLLTAPSPPTSEQRPVVEIAFRNGFEAMKQGLSDPAAFLRVGQILRSLDLTAMALQAEDHARSLAPR